MTAVQKLAQPYKEGSVFWKVGKMLSLTAPLVVIIALIVSSPSWSQDSEGTIEIVEFTSSALESNLIGDTPTRTLIVYLPPGYETSGRRYPVYYFLTAFGISYSVEGWHDLFRNNLRPHLDGLLEDGRSREMITVFIDGFNPFGGSLYASSPATGDWESFVVRELVEHIDATYRTISHRDSRGIDGISMGGFGSLRLALKYPEVFCAVVAQGAPFDLTAGGWWEGGATPEVDPEDWEDMNLLSAFDRFWFAMAAAFAPNPDRPPFYLDRPYELVDGQARPVPEVFERISDMDVYGELDRYVAQPTRLKSIMIHHGSADEVVPVSQAHALVARLTELGLDHVYEEHSGGHIAIHGPSRIFFSENLSFESPTAIASDTWGEVKARH